MSSHKEVIIEMTKEQREGIKKQLDQEVTHLKLWIVPGTVIMAEVIKKPEAPPGRQEFY